MTCSATSRPGGLAMMRWSWVVGALLVSPEPWACAGEKPKEPSDREIKALVAQLVSPNPKPIIGDGKERAALHFRLPKEFDRKKQKYVVDAWGKLRQLGPRAFPFLIE